MEERESLLKRAKLRAAKYCAGRERAPYQVLEKLIGWGLTQEEADSLLAELQAAYYLDERRFCRAFCRDKFEFNHWGKVKIRQELSPYHLPSEVIDYGLGEIDPDKYRDRLHQLARSKWKSLVHEENDWVRKQKAAAYLLRKGYEPELVMDFLNRMSST